MDDSKIIELFFERSEQAIIELSKKYGKLCLKISNNILANESDSDECVNDVLLGVWNTIPPAKPDSLISYVCRITRNLAVKKYRANLATKRNGMFDVCLDELADLLPSDDSIENDLSAEETAKAISEFLRKCKKTDRVIFTRRYFFADKVSDIASLTGKSEHYVSVRLHRTKEKLKLYLYGKGIIV